MPDEIMNKDFSTLLHIIDNARNRALKTVNTELIRMYWAVRLKKKKCLLCRLYKIRPENLCKNTREKSGVSSVWLM